MARTWSVPQRGSFAAFGGLGSQANNSLLGLSSGRGFGHRGVFLVFAALLTAAGAIIPHLDSEILSTFLFLAGAGLAGLVVILSWLSPTRDGRRAAHERLQPDVKIAFGAGRVAQARFPELLAANTAQPGFDRAAWAKLTAHMSHELRTPLNAVLGFSELMTNEVFGPLGSGYSAYARDIHASGRILLKSAEDALAITALLTAPERKRARATSRLKSVVDEACAFAAPDLAARSISIAIDTGADVEVVGDHQAMRQMLINLVAEVTRDAAAGAILQIETISKSEAIDLSVVLMSDDSNPMPTEGFGMILARTLCELSGAELTSSTTVDGARLWNVRILRAMQADLFAAA